MTEKEQSCLVPITSNDEKKMITQEEEIETGQKQTLVKFATLLGTFHVNNNKNSNRCKKNNNNDKTITTDESSSSCSSSGIPTSSDNETLRHQGSTLCRSATTSSGETINALALSNNEALSKLFVNNKDDDNKNNDGNENKKEKVVSISKQSTTTTSSTFPSLSLDQAISHYDNEKYKPKENKVQALQLAASNLSRPITVTATTTTGASVDDSIISQQAQQENQEEDKESAQQDEESTSTSTTSTTTSIGHVPHMMLDNLLSSFSILFDARLRAYATVLTKHYEMAISTTGNTNFDEENFCNKLSLLCDMGTLTSIDTAVTSFNVINNNSSSISSSPTTSSNNSNNEKIIEMPIIMNTIMDISIPTFMNDNYQRKRKVNTITLSTTGTIKGTFESDSLLLKSVNVNLHVNKLLKSLIMNAGLVMETVVNIVNTLCTKTSTATAILPMVIGSACSTVVADQKQDLYQQRRRQEEEEESNKKKRQIVLLSPVRQQSQEEKEEQQEQDKRDDDDNTEKLSNHRHHCLLQSTGLVLSSSSSSSSSLGPVKKRRKVMRRISELSTTSTSQHHHYCDPTNSSSSYNLTPSSSTSSLCTTTTCTDTEVKNITATAAAAAAAADNTTTPNNITSLVSSNIKIPTMISPDIGRQLQEQQQQRRLLAPSPLQLEEEQQDTHNSSSDDKCTHSTTEEAGSLSPEKCATIVDFVIGSSSPSTKTKTKTTRQVEDSNCDIVSALLDMKNNNRSTSPKLLPSLQTTA